MVIVEKLPTARDIVLKTVVTHTVTYFAVGVAAFLIFDYPRLFADTALSRWMRPPNHPMVMAGPLLQPLRGILFGVAFYLLREPFFGREKGWLTMWAVLVVLGVFGTFGATPGSLEGVIYTSLPALLHLTLLPEILGQSLLLSWLVFYWVRHGEKKGLSWAMGAAFAVALLLPAVGLAVRA